MEVRLLDVEGAPVTSLAAVAARLSERCPHVPVDDGIFERGYRFYPMPGSEIPAFFCRRFRAGSRGAALTLFCGVDPTTGEALLESCRSADEARRRLKADAVGLWLVRVTYGPRTIRLDELTGAFWRREPEAFAAIA